jgi:hypothetical protein
VKGEGGAPAPTRKNKEKKEEEKNGSKDPPLQRRPTRKIRTLKTAGCGTQTQARESAGLKTGHYKKNQEPMLRG